MFGFSTRTGVDMHRRMSNIVGAIVNDIVMMSGRMWDVVQVVAVLNRVVVRSGVMCGTNALC